MQKMLQVASFTNKLNCVAIVDCIFLFKDTTCHIGYLDVISARYRGLVTCLCVIVDLWGKKLYEEKLL